MPRTFAPTAAVAGSTLISTAIPVSLACAGPGIPTRSKLSNAIFQKQPFAWFIFRYMIGRDTGSDHAIL
jgi:hypothetical protein